MTVLRLVPLRAEHATAMFAILSDPEVRRYIPNGERHVDSLAARYRRLESRWSPDGSERWLNWIVFDGDVAAGLVQATVPVDGRAAQIAYVLHPRFWGRGFASEATVRMIEYLHATLSVQRYEARIDLRNVRSIALVERMGFRKAREVVDDGASSVDGIFEATYAQSASAIAGTGHKGGMDIAQMIESATQNGNAQNVEQAASEHVGSLSPDEVSNHLQTAADNARQNGQNDIAKELEQMVAQRQVDPQGLKDAAVSYIKANPQVLTHFAPSFAQGLLNRVV